MDFAIVLRLRDVENMGWSRMAQAYMEMTGRYISRDTIKRRYLGSKIWNQVGTGEIGKCILRTQFTSQLAEEVANGGK